MAERRMFAKTIIDSDAFLDMPLSAQALYFHLSMRADDEGFINNPKKIQRMIGATEDDMKILVAKSFVIPFESGIVVIKHWRIHNYIRADRLVETKYREERELLDVKDNGAYTIGDDVKEIEALDSNDIRKIAYKKSSLPYSFTYKIRRAFEGQNCPICNKKMTSAYKNCLPTVQHNIPISKGGVHELENISIICESCNTSIRDTETDKLNNKDVIEIWDKINAFDSNKIKWFDKPSMLWETNDSQVTVKRQSSVSTGKDSIDKDSIDKDIYGAEAPVRSKKTVKTYSEDNSLNEAIKDFIAHRKALKKPMTDKAVDLFLKKLDKMADTSDLKIALINNAIEHGWLSVYPLKDEEKKETGTFVFDIDGFDQSPPFYGMPKEWFENGELVRERIRPVLQKRNDALYITDDILYSEEEVYKKYLRRKEAGNVG